MRKSLAKSLVVAAIVGTTMALTSVATFAATVTSELNFKDPKYEEMRKAKTKVTAGTDLSIDGLGLTVFQDLTIKNDGGEEVAFVEGGETIYDEAVVTSKNSGLRYIKEADQAEGKTSTSTSYRIAFTVKPEKDGKMTVYQNLGAGTTNKQFVYAVDNPNTEDADKNGNAIPYLQDQITYAAGDADAATFYKAEANLEAGKTYYYGGLGTNANLYAVTFEYEDSAEEEVNFVEGTVDQTPAVAYVDGKYYAFAAISAAAASDNTTLKINDKVAEQVYASVSVDGLDKSAAEDFASGAAYVYGVELNVNATTAAIDLETLQSKVAITLSAE